MRTTDKYVFFWRGEFSNWHPAKFRLDGHFFANSEQAFMWLKAQFFGDAKTALKILRTPDPKEAKDLGREVKGYDEEKWKQVRLEKMWQACDAKFRQNPELRRKLLETGNLTLVEASPYDKVWGIGMGENDAGIEDKANWKGENLLGKALEMVRSFLRAEGEINLTLSFDEALALGLLFHNLTKSEGEDIIGILMKHGCFHHLPDDKLTKFASKLESYA